MAKPRKWLSKIDAILRHPLVVVLIREILNRY